MSEKEKKDTKDKERTAPQLFNLYMRTVEKVRALAKSLTEETQKAVALSAELESHFGIRIRTPGATAKTQPITAPADADASNAQPTEEEIAAAAERGYTPPTQMHSEAPTLTGKGSQEVEEIRAGAGLNVDAGDSEALANEGLGAMAELQARMGGTPTIPPNPGQHEPGRSASAERSNAEGGPVTQKPEKEE